MKFLATSSLFLIFFLQFCSVPLSNPNRKLWIDAIEKNQPFDYIVSSYHVCSLHFSLSDIKISGKRKTIISGRFPTIFLPQNVAENVCASGSSRFEEAVNFQQPNVDDNISSEIDGSVLPSFEINSDIHADLQTSNDFNFLDDRENISVLEDDNEYKYTSQRLQIGN